MNQKPLITIGNGNIKISVWPTNADHFGPIYSITPRKIYKKDDQWCSTSSFGDYDLASLIMGLLECYLWCQNEKANHDEAIKLPLMVESENIPSDSEETIRGKLKTMFNREEFANGSTKNGHD